MRAAPVTTICLTVLIVIEIAVFSHEMGRWTKERQLLLERIQRPDRTPVQGPTPDREPLETDGEELALIGQILPEEE
jgi:hypothetical protein